jgi:hypothetical protein
MASMNACRLMHSVTASRDNSSLYAYGGSDLYYASDGVLYEIYSIATDSWRAGTITSNHDTNMFGLTRFMHGATMMTVGVEDNNNNQKQQQQLVITGGYFYHFTCGTLRFSILDNGNLFLMDQFKNISDVQGHSCFSLMEGTVLDVGGWAPDGNASHIQQHNLNTDDAFLDDRRRPLSGPPPPPPGESPSSSSSSSWKIFASCALLLTSSSLSLSSRRAVLCLVDNSSQLPGSGGFDYYVLFDGEKSTHASSPSPAPIIQRQDVILV